MTGGWDPDDQRRRTHRALASVNRLRLVKLLEDGPQDVAALTEMTGFHPNTVRAHLDILADGGVVDRTRRPSTGPGRPAWEYSLPQQQRTTELTDHRLIEALVDALGAVAPEPAAAAEAAGRSWGAQAVAGVAPADPVDALDHVVQLLDTQGFEPELHRDEGKGNRVSLHACPFAELARRHGEIICSVHLGLLRGALEELGTSVQAALQPFVEPRLCMVHLTDGSAPTT